MGPNTPLLLFAFIVMSSYLATAATSSKLIAVVTGANKGIGLEVAKQLSSSGKIKTILACRNAELGEAATRELITNGFDVDFMICDIGSEDSIANFVCDLSARYPVVDILVNNAAIAFKGSDPTPFDQQAAPTMKVNFFGTLFLTKAMLPLLSKSASPRIVNVASQAGCLRILPNEERRRMFTDPDLTEARLCDLMNEFGIHF
jgi:carbonyl reductase 1